MRSHFSHIVIYEMRCRRNTQIDKVLGAMWSGLQAA